MTLALRLRVLLGKGLYAPRWCLVYILIFVIICLCSNFLHQQNILNKCALYINTMKILLTAINCITEFTADDKNRWHICHANFSMIHHKFTRLGFTNMVHALFLWMALPWQLFFRTIQIILSLWFEECSPPDSQGTKSHTHIVL